MLCDYNCKILNIDRCKLFLEDKSLLKNEFEKIILDINELGSLGFHRLVSPVRYDNSKNGLASLNNIFQKEIIKCLNGKFSLSFVPLIYLSEETPYIKNIQNLTAAKSDYIFLELPFSNMPEYLPLAINKILYGCKLFPVFSDFHVYTAIYDTQDIEKLVNIKGAAFQFGIKHVNIPRNLELIKTMLKNGNAVLLGSSCDHDNLNVAEFEKNIKLLKRNLGEELYVTHVMRARSFLM